MARERHGRGMLCVNRPLLSDLSEVRYDRSANNAVLGRSSGGGGGAGHAAALGSRFQGEAKYISLYEKYLLRCGNNPEERSSRILYFLRQIEGKGVNNCEFFKLRNVW